MRTVLIMLVQSEKRDTVTSGGLKPNGKIATVA